MELFNYVWESLSQNDLFQGGLVMAIIGMSGAGLMFTGRFVLQRIDRALRYSVYIDDTGNIYHAFNKWYKLNHPSKYRNVEGYLELKDADVEHWENELSYGEFSNTPSRYEFKVRQYNDFNIINYQGKRIAIIKERETLQNASSNYNRYTNKYRITGLLAEKQITNLMQEVTDFYNQSINKQKGVAIHTRNGGGHSIRTIGVFKKLDRIFFKEKDNIVASIDNHINKMMLYKEQGINHKLGIYLYGPPGTGKTTFAIALADYLKRPIITINLMSFLSDSDFISYVQDITKGCILLIEDIDKYFDKIAKTKSGVNLSTFMNCLDGVYSPENAIFIMTTNHPEKLDKAIIRKGRFDISAQIDLPRLEDIAAFMKSFYNLQEEIEIADTLKKDLNMADVQYACIESENYNNALALLMLEKITDEHRQPRIFSHID